MTVDAGARVDAFTAEVVRTAVVAITDEMKTTLMRTAHSQMIYEMQDFSVGLFDSDGNTISFGLGLPMWISGLGETVKKKIAHWGKENIHPGDVLVTSAAEVHGSHVNHYIFTVPVFKEGELIAFSASMAHWPDVGGVLGVATRDVFSEGFQMPFVKAYKEGVQDTEIYEIIRINTRYPEIAMGDCRAQLATVRIGERRLLALLDKFGSEAFRAALSLIYDQSEKAARTAVRAIPDGVYEAEQFLDDDGINAVRIPVRVKVIIDGDEMTIDLSAMVPQVAGYINCGATAGRSGAEVAFKTLTTPTMLPINDGAMRPLKVILPPGTIVSASKTAAIRSWMFVPNTITDTVWKALTPVIPDRGPAGHHGILGGCNFYASVDEQGRIIPGRMENAGGLNGGGWGAVYDKDGESAAIGINDGETHTAPVEGGEAKSLDIVRQRSLWQDSGGAGRFRGGLGQIQEVEATVPSMYQQQVERTQCPPWGVLGGRDGLANRIWTISPDGTVTRYPNGKINAMRVEPRGVVGVTMGGGGGFGDPLERPAEQVLEDVRNEYVSVEAAGRDYGVAIIQDGPRRFSLDQVETARLRHRANPGGARASV